MVNRRCDMGDRFAMRCNMNKSCSDCEHYRRIKVEHNNLSFTYTDYIRIFG